MSGREFPPVKMKGCKTCKWWEPRVIVDPPIVRANPPHPVGDCRHAKTAPGCDQCWPDVDGATNWGTGNGIGTGPDFCCIHWEDEAGNVIPGVDE